MAIKTAAGSVTTDASGDGTADIDITGEIIAIHTDASDTDAGSDVTYASIAHAGRGMLAETILTLTNLGAATAIDYPKRLVQDTAGADIAANYVRMVVAGVVRCTVAQGGNVKVVNFGVVYDDGK